MGIWWFIGWIYTATLQPILLSQHFRLLNFPIFSRPQHPGAFGVNGWDSHAFRFLSSASQDTNPVRGFPGFSSDSPAGPQPGSSSGHYCDTCALPADQPCFSCDQQFCSRHLYPCSDCQISFCGDCFDLHHLEGHWSDSDTAMALAASMRGALPTPCAQSRTRALPQHSAILSTARSVFAAGHHVLSTGLSTARSVFAAGHHVLSTGLSTARSVFAAGHQVLSTSLSKARPVFAAGHQVLSAGLSEACPVIVFRPNLALHLLFRIPEALPQEAI
jgi:hypothetical protein